MAEELELHPSAKDMFWMGEDEPPPTSPDDLILGVHYAPHPADPDQYIPRRPEYLPLLEQANLTTSPPPTQLTSSPLSVSSDTPPTFSPQYLMLYETVEKHLTSLLQNTSRLLDSETATFQPDRQRSLIRGTADRLFEMTAPSIEAAKRQGGLICEAEEVLSLLVCREKRIAASTSAEIEKLKKEKEYFRQAYINLCASTPPPSASTSPPNASAPPPSASTPPPISQPSTSFQPTSFRTHTPSNTPTSQTSPQDIPTSTSTSLPLSSTASKDAIYAATRHISSNNHLSPPNTNTSTIPFPLLAPLGLPTTSTPNSEKLPQEQQTNNTPLLQPTPLINTATLPCLFKEPFSTQSAQVNLQLPKFTLPKFSGKRMDYPSFLENFRVYVHDNADLPIIQKIRHLETSMPTHLYNLMKPLALNLDGYNARLELLHVKYGDLTKIKTDLYQQLQDLSAIDNKTSSLRTLYDAITVNLALLRPFLTSLDNDNLFELVCSKFPTDLYENHLFSADHDLTHLQATLNEALTMRENTPNTRTSPYQTTTSSRQKTLPPYQGKPRPIKTFFTAKQGKPRSSWFSWNLPPCCYQEHPPQS